MIGYKAFNEDLTCKGFQYEVGGTYTFEGEPIPCKQGFHFCKSISDTYNYYPTSNDTRICKVEAIGDIKTDDNTKYCTNKIVILEEITEDSVRMGNIGSGSSGYCNKGDRNSGDYNNGRCNSGNRNTGDWNTGSCNSGGCNSGRCNNGKYNSGSYNTGNGNSGKCNNGNFNSGRCNNGKFNSGSYNTGDWNSGRCNSGDFNSGDWNSGKCNSGDWNTTNYSSGCFNTEEETIRMFNKQTDITLKDWRYMDARYILNNIKKNVVEWVYEEFMTDEEKVNNPSYKTTGGYLKILDEKDSAQMYWDSLCDDDKMKILNLPNFDAEIFKECTGIDINK